MVGRKYHGLARQGCKQKKLDANYMMQRRAPSYYWVIRLSRDKVSEPLLQDPLTGPLESAAPLEIPYSGVLCTIVLAMGEGCGAIRCSALY